MSGDKKSEICLYTNQIYGQKKPVRSNLVGKKTGNLGREQHSLLRWVHNRPAQVNKT